MAHIRKPNILFIGQLPPPVHGSAVMNEAIVKSERLTSRFDFEVIDLAPKQEITGIGHFSFSKLSHAVGLLVKIVHAVLRRPPDLVYLTPAPAGFALYRDMLILLLLRALRLRRLTHLHTRLFSVEPTIPRWRRTFYRTMFAGATAIAISPLLSRTLRDLLPDERIHVVANGIIDPFPTGVMRSLDDSPRVLFLSNFVESKGPLVLLEALAILRREGVAFRADFVGDYFLPLSEEELSARVTNLGLGAVVTLHGPLHGKSKEAMFRAADIFAFPTFYPNEAFPLVLLEAMAASLPVISTTVGGIPDMVIDGETGLLISPDDVSLLASALRRLITDSALRIRMGQAGRERFIRNYTLEQYEANLSAVLDHYLVSETQL